MPHLRRLLFFVAFLPFSTSASQFEEIDNLFSGYSTDSPGCALSITQRGKITFHHGYGAANLEHGVPIASDTRFYAASTSKQFTALAIALLIKDGKLKRSDSIRKYVPELPSYTDDVTIDQLIHHTDGLRDYFTLLFFQGRAYDNEMPAREILSLVASQQQTNFAAGSKFLYANTGYLLLAKAVESVTGKKLGDFAKEQIFQPLGMTDTEYVHDFRAIVKRRAEGYTQGNGQWLSPRSRFAEIGPSGLVTTVLDLSKWANAIRNQSFGEKITRLLTTPGTLTNGETVEYGYGLFLQTYRGLEVNQHGGARPGYYSNFALVPELELGIALLCNHSSIDAIATTNSIIEIIAGPSIVQTRSVKRVSSNTLRSLAGTYAFSAEANLEITLDDTQLYAQASGEGRYPIYPTSDLEYFYKVADLTITFSRDTDGDVGSLRFRNGKKETVATKTLPMQTQQSQTQPQLSALDKFSGRFFSEELGVSYAFSVGERELLLHIGSLEPIALTRNSEDTFSVFGSTIQFVANGEGDFGSLLVSAQRAHNVVFHKAET